MIKQIFDWVDSNWLNFIFLLLSLFGIFTSFYFYFKGKRRKKPLFAIRSTNVISDTLQSIGDVNVLYKGSEINNLTVTKIVIWNGGNETISFSDLAVTDLLRIEISNEYTIFKAETVFQSSSTNDINLEVDDRVVKVKFDYLDQNQGGVIKVIHSGKKSSNIEIKGTFKGVGPIKEASPSFINQFLSVSMEPISGIRNNKRRLVGKILPLIMLFIGALFVSIPYIPDDGKKSDGKLFFSVMGGFYFLAAILALLSKREMPKEFEIFYDDE